MYTTSTNEHPQRAAALTTTVAGYLFIRLLTRALRGAVRNAGRLILIEAVLDLDDAPPMLRDLTSVLALRNEYAQP
jgi:hypothetical protein